MSSQSNCRFSANCRWRVRQYDHHIRLQPHLIEEWLIKNDFKPVTCAWSSRFLPDQQQAYQGAKRGWQQFF
jgi:hypothetical protein